MSRVHSKHSGGFYNGPELVDVFHFAHNTSISNTTTFCKLAIAGPIMYTVMSSAAFAEHGYMVTSTHTPFVAYN